MKLDKYDILLCNAAAQEVSRPILQNLCLRKGKLAAADGFMLIIRDADLSPEEKELETLIPVSILKSIKVNKGKKAILTISPDDLLIQYKDERGEAIKYNPRLSFLPHKNDTLKYPDYMQIYSDVPTEKKAQIAIDVGLLKRLLACLPDNEKICFGITRETEPMEYDCPNMDRPIRGLVMPMTHNWSQHVWYRETAEEKTGK